MATQQQLNAIMTAESGGYNKYNYLYTTNPNYYTASGYYQITNSTWQNGAQLAGVDTSQYPTAISAPYSVQTQVASALIDKYGMQPWSGSKANTILNQEALGLNPQVVTGPQDGGGGGSTSLGTATSPAGTTGGFGANGADQPAMYEGFDQQGNYLGGTTDPNAYPIAGATSYNPVMSGSSLGGAGTGSSAMGGAGGASGASAASTGYPIAISGLGPWAASLAQWANKTLGAWASSFVNYAARGGLMLLGIVLIIVALIFLMVDRKQVIAMVKTAGEAAAA